MSRFLALLAAALLLCATPGFAQKKNKGEEQTRSVGGVVTAEDGTAVVGAVVQLKNTKNLQIRSFLTQQNGAYYFHGLSPDVDYELTAEYQGMRAGPRTLSSFDSRKEAVINLKLEKKK
jgi:hypothetical protein